MDFSILHDNSIPIKSESIKIRTKRASFVIDPVKSISKVNSDAVILLGSKEDVDLSRVLGYRVVIEGQGEYEVGSVKISGIKAGDGFVYNIFEDNLVVVLGKVSALSRVQDKSSSCQIALLNVDKSLEASVAKLEPRIVILYGEKKTEGAKELGKETVNPVQKFSIAKDKLPGEREVVVLG